MTTTLYGIKACDTMKKARVWLDANGTAYEFHDYRTRGITEALLRSWAAELGWQTILNRAGTTFRKLGPALTADLTADAAIALMAAHPSMIKRPILDHNGRRIAGFNPAVYAAAFA